MAIESIPRINFESPAKNWAVETTGAIQAKGKVAVSWSPDRIDNPNTVDTGDGPSYAVVNAHAHFLGVDTFATLPVAQAYAGAPLSPQDAVFDVPAGATGVKFYFDNPAISSGQTYAEKYDSKFGEDYLFPVASPPTSGS